MHGAVNDIFPYWIRDDLGHPIRQWSKLDFIQYKPRKGIIARSDDELGPSQSHETLRASVHAAVLGQILTCILWRSLVGSIGCFHIVYFQAKDPPPA